MEARQIFCVKAQLATPEMRFHSSTEEPIVKRNNNRATHTAIELLALVLKPLYAAYQSWHGVRHCGSSPSELGSSTINRLYLSPMSSANWLWSLAKTSSLFPLKLPRNRMPSPRSPNGSSLVTQKVEYPKSFSLISFTSLGLTFSGPRSSISLKESIWKVS